MRLEHNMKWQGVGGWGRWRQLSQPKGWAGVAMARGCESPLQVGCRKS